MRTSELKALLAVECHASERLARELICDQPLRASEFCEARVSDLTLDNDQVALTVRVKGGSYKTKVLSTRVASLLTQHLRQREASPQGADSAKHEGDGVHASIVVGNDFETSPQGRPDAPPSPVPRHSS